MDNLPDETIYNIMIHMDHKTLKNIGLTTVRFHNIAVTVWKDKLKNEYLDDYNLALDLKLFEKYPDINHQGI